jgi:hypothetical protein
MSGSQLSQRRDDCFELSVKRAGCGTQLQDQAGVQGILTGRAVMDVASGFCRSARNDGGELFEQRYGKIASGRHGLREGWQIKEFRAAR